MPFILLDKNIPWGLRRNLVGHTIRTTDDEGWSTLTNGDLLEAAEQAGFDVMITADTRIRYQQNLGARRLALVVLSTPAWPVVKSHVSQIQAAIDTATPGSYQEIRLAGPRQPGREGP